MLSSEIRLRTAFKSVLRSCFDRASLWALSAGPAVAVPSIDLGALATELDVPSCVAWESHGKLRGSKLCFEALRAVASARLIANSGGEPTTACERLLVWTPIRAAGTARICSVGLLRTPIRRFWI